MIASKDSTKWNILETVREHGDTKIDVFERSLDISRSTLNEHLTDLRSMDLIAKRSESDGPGRPYHVYTLTDEAEHLFPHSYSKLASILLDVVDALVDGQEGREKIAEIFKQHLNEYDDLETALEQFGFSPEFREGPSGDTTLIYNQCPFYEVVQDHPALCEIDRQVMSELTDQNIEMENSISNGCSQCKFVMTEN